MAFHPQRQRRSSLLETIRAFTNQENRGALIGQQLQDCIENFPVLKTLLIHFNSSATSSAAWKLFAEGGALPALQDLRLSDCKISTKDFSKFVLQHYGTLKQLRLWWLQLEDGSVQDLKDFLRVLRERATIEDLHVADLYLDGNIVHFPAASRVVFSDFLGEEEYVCVDIARCVSLNGTMEVQDGLMLMAEYIKVM